MSFEADLMALLDSFATGRVFWDTLPEGDAVALDTIVIQNMGGRSGQYVEKDARPSHKHARVQIVCFSKHPLTRSNMARGIENALLASSFIAEPYGAFVTNYDATFGLYQAQQQFGIWYPDP